MAFRVDSKEAHIHNDTSYVAIRYRVKKLRIIFIFMSNVAPWVFFSLNNLKTLCLYGYGFCCCCSVCTNGIWFSFSLLLILSILSSSLRSMRLCLTYDCPNVAEFKSNNETIEPLLFSFQFHRLHAL